MNYLTKKYNRLIIKILYLLIDIFCIIGSYYLAYKIRFVLLSSIPFWHIVWQEEFKMLYLKYVLIFTAFFAVTAHTQKLYSCLENDYARELSYLINSVLYTVLALLGISIVFHFFAGVLLSIILGGALISFLLLCIVRFVMHKIVIPKINIFKMKSIIVCDSQTSDKEIKSIIFSKKLWLQFEGIIVVNPEYEHSELHGFHCLGNISDLDKIIKEHNIRAVNFIISRLNVKEIDNISASIEGKISYLWLYPQMSEITATSAIACVEGESVNLEIRDKLMGVPAKLMKRSFDVISSLAVLLFLSPLFLIIALMIKVDSPGPVFFIHARLGKNRKTIGLLKFRTMHENAEKQLENILNTKPELSEEWQAKFKLTNDPRITKIGKFLRKTSLDELPQFVNILQGELSVVGPRPIVLSEVSKYDIWHQMFFLTKPGLTGLWQVSGRNDLTYNSRVQLDRFYVRNWSFSLDIYIILKTIGGLFSSNGAY